MVLSLRCVSVLTLFALLTTDLRAQERTQITIQTAFPSG